MTYVYSWRNNEVRARLFGRPCEVVKQMKRNSVAIRMVDTGELVITSRRALRKREGAE